MNALTTIGDAFTPASSLEYQIDHSYAFTSNALTTVPSKYHGLTFNTDDLTFDTSTGFTTASRDTAGLETTYGYDTSNRLTFAKPPGTAWTEYSYTTANGTSSPASVAVKQRPFNTTSAATPLTDRRIYFDSWGRPSLTKTQMPGGGRR